MAMSQIISASRRTDIPAFHAPWLLDCLEKGQVTVKNPYNPRQQSLIDLSPDQVDAIVFWTKNPAPLLPHLGDIEKAGYRFYFQFTLNAYPLELEPGLPDLSERINSFCNLGEMLGASRVVWRYDPIILSNRTDADYHRTKFAELCGQIGGHTRRVMISLVDYYKKTRRNLRPLEKQGYQFDQDPDARDLLSDLARIAREHELQIFSCTEEPNFSDLGIPPGACIDGELIREVFGIERTWKKDPGQRKHCRCVASRDIGTFNTCRHGCPYCYAAS